MARIRTIKPEFWTSAQVVSCSPIARLLFIGLWSFADDNGVNKACVPSLKMKVFPNDPFTTKDIEQWISELINVGLMQSYEAEGNTYWHITGWHRHQKIQKPTYRYPHPPSIQITKISISNNQIKLDDSSVTIPLSIHDSSMTIPLPINDSSMTEWKGMEGNGKEIYIREAEASPRSINMADVEQVFNEWQKVMNHPKAKLDKTRCKKINHALETYTVEDLKKAIDGCSKTAFNMGQNDNNQRYDDIELILRDSAHIDSFIEKSEATNTPAACYIPESMQGVI